MTTQFTTRELSSLFVEQVGRPQGAHFAGGNQFHDSCDQFCVILVRAGGASTMGGEGSFDLVQEHRLSGLLQHVQDVFFQHWRDSINKAPFLTALASAG